MSKYRVHRGGSYRSGNRRLRSTIRVRYVPVRRSRDDGFRIVVKLRRKP